MVPGESHISINSVVELLKGSLVAGGGESEGIVIAGPFGSSGAGLTAAIYDGGKQSLGAAGAMVVRTAAAEKMVDAIVGVVVENINSLLQKEFALIWRVRWRDEKKLKNAAYDGDDILDECAVKALQLEAQWRNCTNQINGIQEVAFFVKKIMRMTQGSWSTIPCIWPLWVSLWDLILVSSKFVRKVVMMIKGFLPLLCMLILRGNPMVRRTLLRILLLLMLIANNFLNDSSFSGEDLVPIPNIIPTSLNLNSALSSLGQLADLKPQTYLI
ncbi:hypothetical protein NE237_022413 [Protea cynaroides]|uniref:Uncharacterized protein n=1 Tax=Protea cynaroides TaxID=273540 RepID=A0A9Q0HAZ9_9MAGN|nr:hypothetical protein NE237_022413 [Protea cynaroides]